jgi:serine/threonine-protein kinase RsbW
LHFRALRYTAAFLFMPERMPGCDHGCGDRDVFLHFRVSATVEAIGPIVESVFELAHRELGDGKDMELTLALQEALANAVVHGCRRDSSKSLDCWVSHGPGDILIAVRDSGPGFDPDEIPHALAPKQLGADHGRGIHMIRELMDDVHFVRNGAEIHMRKR